MSMTDVDGDAAAGGLGADEAQLVVGAVDEDDPGPQVLRVAGPGLVERGGDHVRGVLADGPGQPLGPGLRPGPERAGAVPAAGRGDHVVRAAFRGLGVVDGDQGGHPLAVRLLPGRQPGPHLPQLRGGLRGGRPQRPGPHHDALAVGRQDQQRRGRARLRDPGGVERGDVGGGVHDGLLDLPLADHRSRSGGRSRRARPRTSRGPPPGRRVSPGYGSAARPAATGRRRREGNRALPASARRTGSPSPCRTAWPAAGRARSPAGSG